MAQLILFIALKLESKLNLHHIGEIFMSELTEIWNLAGYIFEKYFITEKLWDGLTVFWK